MSSTNKTTNYNLSQFVGTDKPAWLSDYNGDMSAIDAQMKLNADAATAAAGSATTANTAIGTLSNLTTDAKTNAVAAINEVDGHADTAQNTASSANSTATSALNKANALETALNLSTITTIVPTVNVGSIEYTTVKSARNSENSLGKLYGKIRVDLSNTSATSVTITLPSAFGAISEGFNVLGMSMRQLTRPGVIQLIDNVSYTLNTDGSVTVTTSVFSDTEDLEIFFYASLLFIKSFGDPVVE